MATLLDGLLVSNSLLEEVAREVSVLKESGVSVKLAVVLVGEDPASKVYVRNKEKACARVGIESEVIRYGAEVSEAELLAKIEELNEDPSVTGFIVQAPLPKHINEPKLVKAINPYKDVDGFHAYNLGKMFLGVEYEDLAPCTPRGMIKILDYYDVDVTGKEVVVLGRSNIVGKPIATMLLNRNATVTVCHSKTADLAAHTRKADILIVAVGRPKMIGEDMVKEGVIVLDVGINRLDDGSLCGDTDFEAVARKASMITPVPGGVGPMTVACLLENTVRAAKKRSSNKESEL